MSSWTSAASRNWSRQAVEGIEVRLREPIDGKAAGPKPPVGRVTPNGERTLGLVRARKPFSDGIDTHRTHPRQWFLGTLVDKASGNDVAPNPAKSHPVPSAAAPALTTDPKPVNLRGLRELARGLRDILAEHAQFPTAPGDVRERRRPAGNSDDMNTRSDGKVTPNEFGG
ncbi:LCP family protein [Streptomyces prasinus]|uniref:LCP family glycopolymer transferase n=1 Tax=Streptomyces prasinus TaxID=67345 RepID=UPI000D14F707|nr:LCP family protein [Streptomyces prasinus]